MIKKSMFLILLLTVMLTGCGGLSSMKGNSGVEKVTGAGIVSVDITATPFPTEEVTQPTQTPPIVMRQAPVVPTVTPLPVPLPTQAIDLSTFNQDTNFGYDFYNLDNLPKGPNGSPENILSDGHAWCYSNSYAAIGKGPWHIANQISVGGDEYACVGTSTYSHWIAVSQAPAGTEPICHRIAPLLAAPCDENN